MFDFLYKNKVLISIPILFLILLIIIACIVYYYYYYRFTKEKEQKEEEQKEKEQKEEVKSSIQYMKYEYKVFLVLMILIFLPTGVGLHYYNYKISKYILVVLIILISIISIIYYYYYTNHNEETIEDIHTGIIKSLEEGTIEERKKVLLNYLDKKFDKKFDYQGIQTGIFYLKKMEKSKRIELYKNIELKYIEKISIGFNLDNKNVYLDEILDTLKPEDKKKLYRNLREKNILLDTERDIVGSILKKIIKLLDKNEDKTIKLAVSILCYDSNKNILIKELKKRNIYNKIVDYVNNKNYGNASCQSKLLI